MALEQPLGAMAPEQPLGAMELADDEKMKQPLRATGCIDRVVSADDETTEQPLDEMALADEETMKQSLDVTALAWSSWNGVNYVKYDYRNMLPTESVFVNASGSNDVSWRRNLYKLMSDEQKRRVKEAGAASRLVVKKAMGKGRYSFEKTSEGHGVPQDLNEALRLFKRAAAEGYAGAPAAVDKLLAAVAAAHAT
ncbi:hypothetical protein M885DRAFT_577612 [Pelagophyceae sp. CCMP2097]|nr:hypothetical protein M885DRAFT_577612 [Pelagophyceae sp. CCMP2097]